MGRNAKQRRKEKRERSREEALLTVDPSEATAVDETPTQDSNSAPIASSPQRLLWHFVLPVAALVALCGVVGIFPIEAEDIFSNIVTGEYLWQQRRLPHTDPFSYTGPHQWFLNRPLPSLLFFAAHSLAGLPGVQLLCAAMLALTYSLTYVVWTRRTGMPLTSFVVVALAVLCSCYWFQTRIYIFGYLLTAVYLLIITSPARRAILWTIPLQVVWINSHPSALLGIVLVLMWCFSRSYVRGQLDQHTSVVALGVLAANMLNPTGISTYWKFFDELLGSHPSRTNILEWLSPCNPMVASEISTCWFFASLVVMARVSYVTVRHWRSIRCASLLFPITGALLALSFTSARHIPFYYISLVGLALCSFEYLRRERSGECIQAIEVNYRLVVTGVTCATVFLIFKIGTGGYLSGDTDRRFGFGIHQRKFPSKPIQIVKDAQVAGNIFTDYGSGSYFLYQAYPSYKIYIDSARLDEVYGEKFFFHYMLIGNNLDILKNDIKKYDLRAFIMPIPKSESEIVVPYRFLSADPDWKLAYFDDAYMLFIRADEAQARGIPTYSRLNPFVNISQLLQGSPDSATALEEDFVRAAASSSPSISVLTLKTLYHLSKGEAAKAAESVAKIQHYCENQDPTTECRRTASLQLARFRSLLQPPT